MDYELTLEKMKTYVEGNLDKAISVDMISQYLGYSTKQLNRILVLKTGMSPNEYLRWTRLSKAAFDVKFTEDSLIDIALRNGYDSQEAFTRAFKSAFSLTPGDYRKSEKHIHSQNWHINRMLQEQSHKAVDRGLFKIEHVDSWIIYKPKRIFAVARRNEENLPANEFYCLCGKEGVMERTGALPDVLIEGGAILTMEHGKNQLSFGVELEENYPEELLTDFEVFHLPEMPYVVFNCPPYTSDVHGSVIQSIWDAQRAYKPEKHLLEWNFGEGPIIESDSDEFGYTMWFPAKDKKEGKDLL